MCRRPASDGVRGLHEFGLSLATLSKQVAAAQVLGDMYLELPDRIRRARKAYAVRKLSGDTVLGNVPPPEERASDDLKRLHVKRALNTHQVGII